ncbi:MAG: Ig-like domain-containing protein [Bacteroidales bacterium]|nr:Ig-like domain-containing protein [Bacteroidales bacterium]
MWKDFSTIIGDNSLLCVGVLLNKIATTLVIGETEQLIATVLPTNATNKAVTWNSTDISVATVSNAGLVTSVSVGIATITVTTEDGNYTATCLITVVRAVEGVQLNKTSDTLVIGETELLTATVLPTNATNKAVAWNSTDTNVATVSDLGLVTGVSVGIATITVTTDDGNYTATCLITVINRNSGVEVLQTTSSLHIYPNPTSDRVYFSNPDGTEAVLYNAQGKLLLRTRRDSIDLSSYPQSIYLIRVGARTAKVVKH